MMIPITRKEKYINEIVGGGNTAPETPQTREEFFFATILGEVVAPSPVTRIEKYLSAIAGQYSSDLPTPITRIEYFLAKAAGMDITVPVPITREEIFWSNYTAIVEFEVEGVPPLTYKAIEGTLENYRIYGDTVDGESVGDRTGNLFDKSGSQYGNNLHWVPTRGLVYSDTYYGSPIMGVTGLNTITRSYTGTSANYFLTSDLSQFVNVSNVGTVDAGVTVNVPDGYTKYVFNIPNTIRPDSIMVNSGSTVLPYEPYGYKVAVTVSNGTDTRTVPIYLPEQIKKVGDEAEYIDYAEQKQHRVRKNLWDGEIESGSWMGFNADDEPYKVDYNIRCRSSKLIAVKNSSVYTISNHEPSTNVQVIVQYRDNNKKFINEYGWADFPCTFTTPSNAAFIEFIIRKPSNLEIMPEDCGDIQLELGSTATEYEPYIENTELDVTLPALPTLPGTNTLTVGTEVQPSNVYIKYEGAQ